MKKLEIILGNDVLSRDRPNSRLIVKINAEKFELRYYWMGNGSPHQIAETIGKLPAVIVPEKGVLVQVFMGSESEPAQYVVLEKVPKSGRLQKGSEEEWYLVED